MNFIPAPGTFLDQRFGWFVHLAGAGKAVFRHEIAWASQGTAFGREWLSRVKLLGRDTRIPRLKAAVDRVQGRSTIAIEPDDLYYLSPSCILVANGSAHIFIPSHADEVKVRAHGPHRPIMRTFGPYIPVAAGSHCLSFDCDPALVEPDSTVMLDIICAAAAVVMVPIQRVPLSEDFVFFAPEGVGDLEIRFYADRTPVRIRGMLLDAG
jgi:hypothetical protein